MKRGEQARGLRGVLFDWDGTLLDSWQADSQAYLAMFHEMGIGWGLEELERHYSPNWYQVYRAARLPRKRWEEADRTWRKHYAKHRPKLIPGARQVLAVLGQRHHLGLVTSGDRSRVTRQLREFRLKHVFSACVCAADTPYRKPHPAPLRLALEKMRLEPAACLYVGDSPEDLEMASSAGVRAVAVLGPFPTGERLRAERSKFLIESIEDLPELVSTL